jgi:exonuclease III
VTDVADIHADIAALKEFSRALARYRHAQRDVVERGDYQIAATRASLEEKASQWRSLLAQRKADLADCQRAAAMEAEAGGHADCSAQAAAVREAQERVESIRRWQQQVEDGASAFLGPASRFRNLLDVDLTRTENHLEAIVSGLEAARGVQVTQSQGTR